MCVHIPRSIWEKHKADLAVLAARDREAARRVVRKIAEETEWTPLGMVSDDDEYGLIDSLLKSIEAKARHEGVLVPA